MRNLILCFFFFLTYATLSAQPDSTYLPFIAEWAPGLSHYFMIEDIENIWENDTLTKSDTFLTMSNLQVLESNENGFLISWRENISPGEIGANVDPDEEYVECEIIYQMDSIGRFLNVQNWKELSEVAIEEFKEALLARSLTKEDSAKTMLSAQPLLSIVTTQEGITSLYTEEILLIHFPFGRALSPVKVENYETTLTAIPGVEVEANAKVYIKTIEPAKGMCQLVQEIRINPDQISKLILGFAEGLGAPSDQIENTFEGATLDMIKTLTYDLQYRLTVPIRISQISYFQADIGKIKRKTLIERVIHKVSQEAQVNR